MSIAQPRLFADEPASGPPPSPRAQRNPGWLPPEARGRRVRVWLMHGGRGAEDATAPGWAADGRGGCRWTLTGDPHDIEWFEVIQ